MISHRITKYNPIKRNPDGSYSDQTEWTSICDIGNPKYHSPTYEDYEKIETAYVEAIRTIMIDKGIDTVKVDSYEPRDLEKELSNEENRITLRGLEIDYVTDIANLENGYEIGFWEIDKIVRLILREMIWMNLVNDTIKVVFGYDYYMYVECEELIFSTILNIHDTGLFVEEGVGQQK